MTDEPRRIVSGDGTPIAVFREGSGSPLLLVHGTSSDHTTFRVVGPMLAARFDVYAIDRRGRGASGDTLPYAIEREFEDVASVAGSIAHEVGRPVDVLGHSYGGRCVLGAALRTGAIGRVSSYEGAPAPPGRSYHSPGLDRRLGSLVDAGDHDGALTTFLREVVGMSADDLAAYRADPVWPLRVAAAPTIVRELHAQRTPAATVDALGAVPQPVLQILGGDSLPVFADATDALQERLASGRIVVIDGARHAAHHTHPEAIVRAVTDFLET